MNNIKSAIDYVASPYIDTWKCLIRDTGHHEHNVQMAQIAKQKLTNIAQERARADNRLSEIQNQICGLEEEITTKRTDITELPEPTSIPALHTYNDRKNVLQSQIDTLLSQASDLGREFNQIKENYNDKTLNLFPRETVYRIESQGRQITHYTTMVIGAVAIARALSLIAATTFAALTVTAFASTSGFTAFVLTTTMIIPTLLLHDVYQVITTAQKSITGAELRKPISGGIVDAAIFAKSVLSSSFTEAKSTADAGLKCPRFNKMLKDLYKIELLGAVSIGAGASIGTIALSILFPIGLVPIAITGLAAGLTCKLVYRPMIILTTYTECFAKNACLKIKNSLNQQGAGEISWILINNVIKTIEQNTILMHVVYRTITNPAVKEIITKVINNNR